MAPILYNTSPVDRFMMWRCYQGGALRYFAPFWVICLLLRPRTKSARNSLESCWILGLRKYLHLPRFMSNQELHLFLGLRSIYHLVFDTLERQVNEAIQAGFDPQEIKQIFGYVKY